MGRILSAHFAGAILCGAMIIVMTICLRASGATYCVAPTGGNDGSGHGTSATDPLNTITKAVSLSAAGDTIYLLDRFPATNLQPTNFNFTSQLNISKVGTDAKPYNLFSYP